jgi:hypothetical protein
MIGATNRVWAPWHVAITEDKKRGRLNIISHLLSSVPYAHPQPADIKLPRRRKQPEGYHEANLDGLLIPTPW